MGAHDPQSDPRAGDAFAEVWIVDRTVALGDGDDAVEFAGEADLLPEGGDAAFEGQQTHRDLPSVAGGTDDEVGVGDGVVEEDLVELGGAGELLNGPHRDAGLVEGHEQEAQAVMTGRTGFGPCDDEGPLCDVCERRPDLLAVDHPLVALEAGGGGDVGEVGAGSRFRVALRPQFGDVADPGQEALLLLLGPERDEGGAEQFLTEVVDARGRVRLRVLLVEDHALIHARAATAVLGGPADAGPSGLCQVTIPRESLFEEFVFAAGSALASELGEFAGQIVFEPLSYGGRELRIVLALALVHVCTITYQAIAR